MESARVPPWEAPHPACDQLEELPSPSSHTLEFAPHDVKGKGERLAPSPTAPVVETAHDASPIAPVVCPSQRTPC